MVGVLGCLSPAGCINGCRRIVSMCTWWAGIPSRGVEMSLVDLTLDCKAVVFSFLFGRSHAQPPSQFQHSLPQTFRSNTTRVAHVRKKRLFCSPPLPGYTWVSSSNGGSLNSLSPTQTLTLPNFSRSSPQQNLYGILHAGEYYTVFIFILLQVSNDWTK